MKLYVVRHATASSKSSWTDDDALRPLTATGRKRFAAAAASIARVDASHPEVVVTSPLVRAVQTAEIFANAFGNDVPVEQDARLGLSLDAESLAAVLAEHRAARTIAIVGHNPSISKVLSAVTGTRNLEMAKGAIALVKLTDQTKPVGQLLWLTPPDFFAKG